MVEPDPNLVTTDQVARRAWRGVGAHAAIQKYGQCDSCRSGTIATASIGRRAIGSSTPSAERMPLHCARSGRPRRASALLLASSARRADAERCAPPPAPFRQAMFASSIDEVDTLAIVSGGGSAIRHLRSDQLAEALVRAFSARDPWRQRARGRPGERRPAGDAHAAVRRRPVSRAIDSGHADAQPRRRRSSGLTGTTRRLSPNSRNAFSRRSPLRLMTWSCSSRT
jgi:hypothetical protein